MDLSRSFSLEGRTAVVTGGSRGLGRTIAEGFIAQGAKVYISSRKADACNAAAEELGPTCHSLPADVSTLEGCGQLVAQYAAKENSLDILVNNAGAAWGASFDDFPEHGWDKVIDINLKSPFFLSQQFAPLLRKGANADRPAKVINISSVEGQRISAWETYSYQASKAGLIHLTRRIAAALVGDHVYVTSIAPGFFASDMNRAARDRGDDAATMIPAGRIGRPEDIAAAAVFLAAASGDYIVGETLTVDGGLVHASFGPTVDP